MHIGQASGSGSVQSIFSAPARRSAFAVFPKMLAAPCRYAKNALHYSRDVSRYAVIILINCAFESGTWLSGTGLDSLVCMGVFIITYEDRAAFTQNPCCQDPGSTLCCLQICNTQYSCVHSTRASHNREPNISENLLVTM